MIYLTPPMPTKRKLTSLPQRDATFIEPMECLSVSKLPEGAQWLWEIKLDGYRAIAVKSSDAVTLFSRKRKSLNRQFPYIVEALAGLPVGTVVDGELVAIDESGRPDFNLLQNFRSAASRIQYRVFDLLCLKGHDLTHLPLVERRALLKSLPIHDKRIRIVDYVEASATDLLAAVRQQSLEGIIGKRKDSLMHSRESRKHAHEASRPPSNFNLLIVFDAGRCSITPLGSSTPRFGASLSSCLDFINEVSYEETYHTGAAPCARHVVCTERV
jgi:ATP-dependent DNA ligase